MGDHRTPLDRVKDAVAGALGRRSRDGHTDERTDDADRAGVDGLAEPVDPRLLIRGMIVRPDAPSRSEESEEPDG